MTPGRRAAVLALVSQCVSAHLRDGGGESNRNCFFARFSCFSFFSFNDSLTYWPGKFAMPPMEETPEAPRRVKSKLLEGGTSLARG